MRRTAAKYVRPGVWRRPGLRGVCPLVPLPSRWPRCYSASAPVAAREEETDDSGNDPYGNRWYQLHPPEPDTFLGRLFGGYDNWFSLRFLTPESRELRWRRYETLVSRVNMGTGEEIPVPRPNPLARAGSVFVDNMFLGFVDSVLFFIPIVGWILMPVSHAMRESYRARWSDRASIGRGLFGLRVISLSGPDSEASALALRSSLPMLMMGTCGALGYIPIVGEAFHLAAFFAMLALPLQTFIGNGRTWVDYVANTQVIRDKHCD